MTRHTDYVPMCKPKLHIYTKTNETLGVVYGYGDQASESQALQDTNHHNEGSCMSLTPVYSVHDELPTIQACGGN